MIKNLASIILLGSSKIFLTAQAQPIPNPAVNIGTLENMKTDRMPILEKPVEILHEVVPLDLSYLNVNFTGSLTKVLYIRPPIFEMS